MLNENLIKLRKKTNKTQYDIAKLLNISRATYGSYEQGTRTPSPEMLVKLSNLYNVSVDYLLDKDANAQSYNRVTFGEKIESLRKENRLTQAEFAEKLGVTRTTVGKWELNNNYPNQAVLMQICKVFNCSLDSLLTSVVEEEKVCNENKISIFSRNGPSEEIILSDEDLEMARNILKVIKEKNKNNLKDF